MNSTQAADLAVTADLAVRRQAAFLVMLATRAVVLDFHAEGQDEGMMDAAWLAADLAGQAWREAVTACDLDESLNDLRRLLAPIGE